MGESKPQKKPVVIHIKLDPDMHRAFKVAAANADLSMQRAVELLICQVASEEVSLEDIKKNKI